MTKGVRIGLLGFGEVGQVFAADLINPQVHICAYDLLFDEQESNPFLAAQSNKAVELANDTANLIARSDIIISAVTAEQALSAAVAASSAIDEEKWYFDVNSAAPQSKAAAAKTINAAGGRYVEASIMSPVPPKRLNVPVLLGGPHAPEFQKIIQALGFQNTSVYSTVYGQAAAAKMCRSVIVKGVEALLAEALVSARAYGVEETVLSSLDDLFPGPDWPDLAGYMISRAVQHGTRRAEEMREVAKTIESAGLPPHMSLATSTVQDWASQFNHACDGVSLRLLLDALRKDPVRPDQGNRS